MEIRRNHLLQEGPSTIWRSREGRSCLRTSYILKIIRVYGISSATFSTRDSQKNISVRSWMRTKSQAPTIPQMLRFEPQTQGEVESEDARRVRERGQVLADKSYAAREAQHFDGSKKLAAKFNRASVLVLKHTDALINWDMHQFLNSDLIKRLDPETKYRRLRQYFSERWGPHSSLDVAKIKSDITSMRGDGASTCRI